MDLIFDFEVIYFADLIHRFVNVILHIVELFDIIFVLINFFLL
jgi:hypothetical protein